VAHDGAAALAQAAAFHPQAVLCDLSLPGALDGWALAREMRRDPALAGALLVAMSGYGEEEDRERGRQAGFDEYLIKPLDFARLREILFGA
jgi:CheY-like chemotaxis protein